MQESIGMVYCFFFPYLQHIYNNNTYSRDPVDQTVVANEQVDALGRSWRSGALVEKKSLKQWFFQITDYANDLLDDLDTLPEWPSKVKSMQQQWIGKSTGAMVSFHISSNNDDDDDDDLSVFTTRPDTIMGVTYVVLAPEHPYLAKAIENGVIAPDIADKIKTYINSLQRSSSNGDYNSENHSRN